MIKPANLFITGDTPIWIGLPFKIKIKFPSIFPDMTGYSFKSHISDKIDNKKVFDFDCTDFDASIKTLTMKLTGTQTKTANKDNNLYGDLIMMDSSSFPSLIIKMKAETKLPATEL